MDKFKVVLLPQALKFYKKCPVELANRINRCFEDLEKNPFAGSNIKQLRSSKKWYRYRVGTYRVIYEIDKKNKRVGILLISPRGSAYRGM